MKNHICLGIQFFKLTAAADFKISSQRLKLVKNTASPKVCFSCFKDFEISTLLMWIMGETDYIHLWNLSIKTQDNYETQGIRRAILNTGES